MEDSEPKRRGRPPGVAASRVEAPASEQTVKVMVARDYWDENEQRVRSGTIIDVPVSMAMRGIKSGALDIVED